MTDDLDTLRPEVSEAVEHCDRNFALAPYAGHRANWPLIRAELLRLARENDEWQTRCLQFQTERDKARAELAAIKARIAKAPTAQLIDQGRVTQQWYVRATDGSLLALPPALSGKRVRLVVEE